MLKIEIASIMRKSSARSFRTYGITVAYDPYELDLLIGHMTGVIFQNPRVISYKLYHISYMI